MQQWDRVSLTWGMLPPRKGPHSLGEFQPPKDYSASWQVLTLPRVTTMGFIPPKDHSASSNLLKDLQYPLLEVLAPTLHMQRPAGALVQLPLFWHLLQTSWRAQGGLQVDLYCRDTPREKGQIPFCICPRQTPIYWICHMFEGYSRLCEHSLVSHQNSNHPSRASQDPPNYPLPKCGYPVSKLCWGILEAKPRCNIQRSPQRHTPVPGAININNTIMFHIPHTIL